MFCIMDSIGLYTKFLLILEGGENSMKAIVWRPPTTIRHYIVVLAVTTIASVAVHVFREDMIGVIHDIIAFVISIHGFIRSIK